MFDDENDDNNDEDDDDYDKSTNMSIKEGMSSRLVSGDLKNPLSCRLKQGRKVAGLFSLSVGLIWWDLKEPTLLSIKAETLRPLV